MIERIIAITERVVCAALAGILIAALVVGVWSLAS